MTSKRQTVNSTLRFDGRTDDLYEANGKRLTASWSTDDHLRANCKLMPLENLSSAGTHSRNTVGVGQMLASGLP